MRNCFLAMINLSQITTQNTASTFSGRIVARESACERGKQSCLSPVPFSAHLLAPVLPSLDSTDSLTEKGLIAVYPGNCSRKITTPFVSVRHVTFSRYNGIIIIIARCQQAEPLFVITEVRYIRGVFHNLLSFWWNVFSCHRGIRCFHFFISFFVVEIPTEPVMVFQDDNNRVKVVLNFNAEVSNVLIVNARALGDAEKDCSVTFDMCGVSIKSTSICLGCSKLW